uniref:Uncharacterized protein n=1 Tax=Chromera velia CCMP2878 TaxID=1169474 RepID=A0A0G4HWC5_9ALVE|mmetsp:Transcript_34863/g.68831  ORF Transcript_34863/g.68831 Transcript_34863/m.68831 type:complete len:132 (-) Transcript_34863:122-517(-)|eukprot:Cvel_9025.t1-p1 / transcript=Cvel_9025.t1 / gene=Cvel_9025 / organism=Chromera_velia_CCMP2878 / gene_product=hypothetical protein / transcript_product=hypothetical protein / location=Cvel_scaffold511:63725-65080(+) / protein_length=131 / sequence_SO=supercontig / SO=protein_coding / is_pseudo=false
MFPSTLTRSSFRSLALLAARKRKWQSAPVPTRQDGQQDQQQNFNQQQPQYHPPPAFPGGAAPGGGGGFMGYMATVMLSMLGFVIATRLMWGLFGGPRVNVVHVNKDGQQIDPRTGQPYGGQQPPPPRAEWR